MATTALPWLTWDGDLASLPCFVINLNPEGQRWAYVQKKVAPLLPKLERFPGVDGRLITDDELKKDARVAVSLRARIIDKERRWKHEEMDNKSGIGCALSHIKLWKHIVQRNHPLTLVMEDGVQFDESNLRKVKQAFSRISNQSHLSDKSVWFLNHKWYEPHTPLATDDKACEFMISQFHIGMQAYIITQTAAQELLKHALPVEFHIDHFVTKMTRLQVIQTVTHPNIVTGRNRFQSTIGHSVPMCDIHWGMMILCIVIVSVLFVCGVTGLLRKGGSTRD